MSDKQAAEQISTVFKSKPGWMRPLPKEDRGKGYLPVKTRGPLRESDAERELDYAALRREPFVDQLADAAVAGGESLFEMRERLEQDGFHPNHVADILKAGTEIATQRVQRHVALAAWSYYPETVEGRVAVHNARGSRPGTLTAGQWAALLAAWGGSCAYCGEQPAMPTIEHVVPICQGGVTELGNVVPSCGACNRLKRNKTAEEWLLEGYPAWRDRFDAANEEARVASEVQS